MIAARFMRLVLGFVPWSLRDRIRRMPVVAMAQRAFVSLMLDGREFAHRVDSGPAKGVTFRIRMPEDKGIWTGTYERAFATRLAAAVQAGTVTYDIGSWHGFFAGVMAAHGSAQVHVFEPLPANVERIRQLIALNPDKPITLHPCAVGEQDTEMDLLVMPETSMAKLEMSTFQSDKTSETRLRVRVRSIDSLVASGAVPAPALIKIDVEGAEVLVLKGARATLLKHRPTIFAEFHSPALLAECEGLLHGGGYRLEHLASGGEVERASGVFQVCAFPV